MECWGMAEGKGWELRKKDSSCVSEAELFIFDQNMFKLGPAVPGLFNSIRRDN